MKKNLLLITLFIIFSFAECGDISGSDSSDSAMPQISESVEDINNTNEDKSSSLVENADLDRVDDDDELPQVERTEKTEYVSASGFWSGDDYFDIEGYLEANCVKVKMGTMDLQTGSFTESNEKHDYYIAYFDMSFENNASITIYAPAVHSMFIMHGDNGHHYEFYPSQVFENSNDLVTVNQLGNKINRITIDSIVYAIELYKANPYEEDPFTNYEDGRFGQSWFDKGESYVEK